LEFLKNFKTTNRSPVLALYSEHNLVVAEGCEPSTNDREHALALRPMVVLGITARALLFL
jgi:hypothetical protein